MSLVRRFFGSMILASLTAVCANAAITPVAPGTDGAGCYEIGDAAGLYGFAAMVTEHEMNGTGALVKPYCVKLTDDIIVNTGVLKTDGSVNAKDSSDFVDWIPMYGFSGTFDGQGHVISGLFANNPKPGSGIGLFGSLYETVEIKNLGIVNSFFSGAQTAAFIGNAFGGATVKFLNCFSNNYIEAPSNSGNVGGFVGYVQSTEKISIINSYSVGTIVGPSGNYRGAFVGRNPNSYGGSLTSQNSYYSENLSSNVYCGISKRGFSSSSKSNPG